MLGAPMDDSIHEAIPLDGTAEDAPAARAAARSVLRRAGCDDDLAGDALLCLSELVANAVLHAGGSICVEITATATSVRLEVTDGTPPGDPVRGVTGRGLAIVEQLTTAWGVVATVVAGRPGKIVWAELVAASGVASANRAPVDVAIGEAVFLEVPIRLFLASESHLDALLRDMQLLAAEWSSRHDRFVKELAEALRRNQEARTSSMELVRRHLADGHDVVTLRFPLTSDAPDQARAFNDAVTGSEARTGRSDDDTPSAEELRHFRRWYLAELTHQALGGEPRRCPFRP